MANETNNGGVADVLTGRRSRRGDRTAVNQSISLEKEILFSRIKEGRIIPVVSNSLSYDAIFSRLVEQAAASADPCSPLPLKFNGENLLSQGWAKSVKYPFPDSYELARVAQYNRWKKIQVNEAEFKDKEDETAKHEYYNFLKESIINYGDYIGEEVSILDELEASIGGLFFDEMAARLELPRYDSDDLDPLHILARFPLPIYITTSPHMFLERALKDEKKNPRTQVCFWSGKVETPEVTLDPGYTPKVTEPVVFHLFGLDRCLSTVVLTEDDYLNFLVKLAQDVNADPLIIPPKIRSSLSVSSLLLLGYRLEDWDFRVLYRGLIASRPLKPPVSNLILQLDPNQQYNAKDVDEARNFLKTYFEPEKFGVEWGKTEEFLIRLRQEYSEWIQTHP